MATLREWFDRLLGTLRARRSDADLEAALRAHAELAGVGYASRVSATQTMDALRDRLRSPGPDRRQQLDQTASMRG